MLRSCLQLPRHFLLNLKEIIRSKEAIWPFANVLTKYYPFMNNKESLLSVFFKEVLGTQFGSLESEKTIVRSLKSENIGSLESEKSGPCRSIMYLTFSLKKTLLLC